MKRLTAALLGILMLWCVTPRIHAEEVETSARAFVLYCADSGALLLSENPDLRLPMASTTKLMTVLLTLENAEKDDRVVEFTDEMSAEGSSMELKAGDRVRLSDLAAGMMMRSGNDAANAAAIAIAGSTEAFADLMNRRAAEIGMKNTHFVTPSGLDDEEHYSTARDMALLMAHALKNDRFRKLTAKTSETVRFVRPASKRATYPNHNRLLSLYDGCIGGKTGYTATAGRCLVTAAKKNGLTLIAVTLDDRNDWDDHIALYEYGFSLYTTISPDIAPDISVPVAGGTADETAVYAAKSAAVAVPRDRIGDVRVTVMLPPFLYAPVEKNQAIGRVVYTLDGRRIGEIPLLCADEIAYDSRRRGFFEAIADVLRL